MATLVGTQKDLNSLLTSLIELDLDAVEAYEAAIERVDLADARDALATFRDDHRRHVRELGAALRRSGREPPAGPEAMHWLASGKQVITALTGDKALLAAMKTNEDDTNTAYERAVVHGAVSPHLKELMRANLADARRHRAWLERRIETLD